MDKKEKVKRVEEELNVLKDVIDYADRMICEDANKGVYLSLRRHAYGKTVLISTENQGVLIFRLSSTSAVYPNRSSGYATPHSPVGRLCAILQAGDKKESLQWGEYIVLETRIFDRFDGIEFASNVRNFLRMIIRQQQDKDEVINLSNFLNIHSQVSDAISSEELYLDSSITSDISQSKNTISDKDVVELAASKNFSFMYEVDEELDDDIWSSLDYSEEEEGKNISLSNTEEYFGLNETFYLDRTLQQDRVISRSPTGALYVQGVAGSGKTSAALGRTKMLCDFNYEKVYSQEEFRSIVGDSDDYWSQKFAGKFSQEGSVGFVRTGELIQYLKETCRRLDLSNLPIQEYSELRSRLLKLRHIEKARKGSRRWVGIGKLRETHIDSTIQWLKVADCTIAKQWASDLLEFAPTTNFLVSTFKKQELINLTEVIQPAVNRLYEELKKISKSLLISSKNSTFILDGLAKRIDSSIEKVSNEILGGNVFWMIAGGIYYYANSEYELAKLLVSRKIPLYLNDNATRRLVIFDDSGLIDSSLTILDQSGKELSDELINKDYLKENLCMVLENNSGNIFPAVISDTDELYLRLLPESSQKVYGRDNKKLIKIRIVRGLGQVKFPIMSVVSDVHSQVGEQFVNTESKYNSKEKNRSVSVLSLFKNTSRKKLIEPLMYVADAYANALKNNIILFPDENIAEKVSAQLEDRRLTSEDIDLLLCLIHIIGRGFEGNPKELSTPQFYQSVFIDEVQDFTEQQVYLMSEQADPNYAAVTIVGDLSQKLHNGNDSDISGCFPGKHLEIVQLSKNMRQAESLGIAWFSARFRMEMYNNELGQLPEEELLQGLANAPEKIRGPEVYSYINQSDLVEHTVKLLISTQSKQTSVVILPSPEIARMFFDACKPSLDEEMIDAELSDKIDLSRRYVRHFTSIQNAKGLEFDLVILPFFECYDMTLPLHQNQIYVGLTRAKQRMVLIGNEARSHSLIDHIWNEYQDIVTPKLRQ